MLKTLSIRTGLLSLLAVMTLLLLIVSGIGIYALTQSSASLQRINHLQGEQMVQLNAGYTLILRARNEAGQAVRMIEVGLLDDAARAVKTINQEVALAQKTLKDVIGSGVAGEVRNLASRSADAAKEIRSLISDSQTHVNEGSELAQQAGETMDEIATEVLRMTKLMREIATASQEQSRGIEQVNIAVNKMDETAQQNAALVQQSSAATRSLEEQSRELMEAMASFKLTTQTA
ncbi:Tar ligand binding domain-containing protein [Enterobacter hormaechei]|nr:Tar ligand binding domain-containing protein [Enterobacter hormaechei]